MPSDQRGNQRDTIQWIHQRLDKFEERIDKLEGQESVATKWLEKIELRLERVEEVHPEMLRAIAKLQGELELNRMVTDRLQKSLEVVSQENRDNREIIMQLLESAKKDREALAQMIEGDKGRKHERFLQVWAILGPVIASVLTSLFSKYLF
jgi:septal ring factor EnvC (AmiA/AmiB activator)